MADEKEAVPTTEELGLESMSGAFVGSLKRGSKQIRTDRAIAIAEGASLTFRRTVEDLELRLKEKRRERATMLDMSPENAYSLTPAKDFNPRAWVDKYLELGLLIRNIEIELEIARKDYEYLFGGK